MGAKRITALRSMGAVALFIAAMEAWADPLYDDLGLKQAIEIALANSSEKMISVQSAAIAESQYQEALSANWPSLSLQLGIQRRDEPPVFIFPSSSIPLGDLGMALGSALGPLLPPGAALPTSINVPEQRVKLLNRQTTASSLQLVYPVYTGGRISSLISQADHGRGIAQEELRRTQLQIVRDVKRYYYATQLTAELVATARDTVDMLESTRNLTKKLYEGGASLNKLDYLKTEMAVSYAQSVAADFENRHQAAKAALIHAMGLPWNSTVRLKDSLDAVPASSPALDQLIAQANAFNPHIGMLKLAVQVASAKIDEARSGHLPTIALTAETTHYSNSYEKGLGADANRNTWIIGVGLSLPLFDGWRTQNQVGTARLQHAQMRERAKLVEQGTATLVKGLFIELDGARKQAAISQDALKIAREHAELTSRAFQIGASKPQDVIEAQVLQAIVQGNLIRARHDQLLKLAEIDHVIGTAAY